ALGRVLYSEYLLAFEVVSLVLTVAVIGAIVLALPERLGMKVVQRQGTISLGHARGVDEMALSSGAIEESPILTSKDRIAAKATGGRRLVMTKDPDEYTGAK
ncbi:MAG: hypothetical protein ACRDHN_08915, partial [Thermomicrobiales bacterium]